MKGFKISILTFCLISSSICLTAQSKIKSYDLKKGQVFDIIFLNKKPDTDVALQEYFKLAFPVAQEMGYNALPGFSIKQNPTQGNYHPENMIFGYWTSLEGRVNFLNKIEDQLPDFHERRRQIWSNFDMTYFVLNQDLSFKVNTEKLNVVSTYWHKDEKSFQKFRMEWVKETEKAGGQIILSLSEGESPIGYYHKPDHVIMTEWEDKAAFDKFYNKNLKMDHSSVKHVNQFIVE